jgi:hypothetical protein
MAKSPALAPLALPKIELEEKSLEVKFRLKGRSAVDLLDYKRASGAQWPGGRHRAAGAVDARPVHRDRQRLPGLAQGQPVLGALGGYRPPDLTRRMSPRRLSPAVSVYAASLVGFRKSWGRLLGGVADSGATPAILFFRQSQQYRFGRLNSDDSGSPTSRAGPQTHRTLAGLGPRDSVVPARAPEIFSMT